MLRKQSSRAAFFAGTRRLQSELIGMSAPPVTTERCAFLEGELERNDCLSPGEVPPPTDPAAWFCDLVIRAHAALLREGGFFFPENAELLAPGPTGSEFAFAVPRIPGGTGLAAELLERLARLGLQSALQQTSIADWLPAIRGEIAKVRPPFLAVSQMVRAAYELELPILEWHSVFFQAGHGKNATALTGSITEQTSSIGVHFAREKSKANELLARAGFPIARGGLVEGLADAQRRARALGYPVVVKPADKDGGQAVSSDVRTDAELEQAYARAREASARVMVEKHVDGTDYRLLLHHDRLLVALERTPGGVVGDGSATVAELLERVNRERTSEDDGASPPLHPIVFDAEAQLMLRRQGLTARSVPEEGRFVPLRRAANHALGGMVRLAENIHPDNVDLARRAMRLLRLDIAGLDLILPDITRSWREAGGAICEVNAQPFVGEVIGRDYYKEILQELVPGGGRIPLVLLVGTTDAETLAQIEAGSPGLAVVDGHGARRDGHPLSVEGMQWPHACQAPLYDQETAAALCVLDPAQPIPPYSPVDRFSAAVVLDVSDAGVDAALALLLRRAGKALYAAPEAVAALKKAGLKATAVRQADLQATLAGLLAGETIPAAARPKPARRGKAPPASRKRR